MKQLLKLKQLIPSQFCLACDGCCRFNEPDTIWAPYGIKLIPYKDGVYLCPHFEFHTHICKIYKNRPLDCILYPFILTKPDKKVYLAIDKKCPFVIENQDRKSFKEYITHLKEIFKQKSFQDFLRENLQSIPDYQEDIIILDEIVGTKR